MPAPSRVENPRADFDGAWKEALLVYLRSLIELCFPAIASQIDWKAKVIFLDQELQKTIRDAKLGKRRVDKLVEVRLLNGKQQWILLHVEVASQPHVDLAKVMYRYHHQLEDRFDKPVISVAILADPQPRWRPSVYRQNLLGCRTRFEFPTCKLLDLAKDWAALERNPSPAALIVMAHVKALQSSGDPKLRLLEKIELTRQLYRRGYDRKDIAELYRLVDWLLALPEEWGLKYRDEVLKIDKEAQAMPYITSIERIGREDGRIEGTLSIVLVLLRERLGTLKPALRQSVKELSLPQLRLLGKALLNFENVGDLKAWLAKRKPRTTTKSKPTSPA